MGRRIAGAAAKDDRMDDSIRRSRAARVVLAEAGRVADDELLMAAWGLGAEAAQAAYESRIARLGLSEPFEDLLTGRSRHPFVPLGGSSPRRRELDR